MEHEIITAWAGVGIGLGQPPTGHHGGRPAPPGRSLSRAVTALGVVLIRTPAG